MLRWIILFFRGYVRFELRGQGLEDAVNYAVAQGAEIWHLERTEKVLLGYTRARHYQMLSGACRKSGAYVRTMEKHGLPFWVFRYRGRPGLLIGAVLFLFLIIFSQNFIWRIDMSDYNGKYYDYLLQRMSDKGVRVGAYAADMDFRLLQQEILMELEEISWIALNINGSVLEVKVSEKVVPPEIVQTTPCNIVAKKDGQILSAQIYSGDAVVSELGAVRKGDLLVSGVKYEEDGYVGYVHADAAIYAETHHAHTIRFALEQEEPAFTGETHQRYYVEILGVRIPLFVAFSFAEEYERRREEMPLTILDAQFPVSLLTDTYYFYETEHHTYTEQDAREIVTEAFSVYEESELGHVEILSYDESQEFADGVLTVTRSYTCREDIAKKIPLYVEDPPQEEDKPGQEEEQP